MTWVNSLKEGLAKSDLTLPIAYDDIAFPYYGDILDDLIYGSEAAGAGAEVIAHSPEDDEELRFKQQLAEAFADKAGISKDQILEASGDPTLEHGPANWEWVQCDCTRLRQIRARCPGRNDQPLHPRCLPLLQTPGRSGRRRRHFA